MLSVCKKMEFIHLDKKISNPRKLFTAEQESSNTPTTSCWILCDYYRGQWLSSLEHAQVVCMQVQNIQTWIITSKCISGHTIQVLITLSVLNLSFFFFWWCNHVECKCSYIWCGQQFPLDHLTDDVSLHNRGKWSFSCLLLKCTNIHTEVGFQSMENTVTWM